MAQTPVGGDWCSKVPCKSGDFRSIYIESAEWVFFFLSLKSSVWFLEVRSTNHLHLSMLDFSDLGLEKQRQIVTLISFVTLKKASCNTLALRNNLFEQINCEIQICACTKVILNRMSDKPHIHCPLTTSEENK